jgi:hypothetical protein
MNQVALETVANCDYFYYPSTMLVWSPREHASIRKQAKSARNYIEDRCTLMHAFYWRFSRIPDHDLKLLFHYNIKFSEMVDEHQREVLRFAIADFEMTFAFWQNFVSPVVNRKQKLDWFETSREGKKKK